MIFRHYLSCGLCKWPSVIYEVFEKIFEKIKEPFCALDIPLNFVSHIEFEAKFADEKPSHKVLCEKSRFFVKLIWSVYIK